MKVIFREGFELEIAIIAEIDELKFEMIPVVEGKVVRVDLLIESQPFKG